METNLFEESVSLMLDGNAMAGILHEVFDVEMTVGSIECASCGQTGEMGSLWAFMESPGYERFYLKLARRSSKIAIPLPDRCPA